MAKKMGIDMPGVDAALAEKAAGTGVEEKKVKPAPVAKSDAKVNVNVKKEEQSVADAISEQAEKEVKSVAVNLRVKPSVKKRFDFQAAKLRYSQSDLFEIMVALVDEILEKKNGL